VRGGHAKTLKLPLMGWQSLPPSLIGFFFLRDCFFNRLFFLFVKNQNKKILLIVFISNKLKLKLKK
jgi:hypothetical protein